MSKFARITARFLWRNLRCAVLIATLAACFIAPTPRASDLLLFMAPMLLLYFVAAATFAAIAGAHTN